MNKVFFLLLISLAVCFNAQPGIRLRGSAAIPAGQLETHVDAGFGGNISFNLPVLFPGLEATLTTGYYYCGLKEDLPGYDFNFSSIPVTLGLRYVFVEGSEISPYVGVEGGVFFTEYFLQMDYGVLGKPEEITKEISRVSHPKLASEFILLPDLISMLMPDIAE